MVATVFNVPEFKLSEPEAKHVATCAMNVARHYDFEATQKAADWTALAMALAGAYGTRLIAIRINRKRKESDDGTVAHFPV